MTTAWKDLTKEEKAERIKAGQEAAKQRRAKATDPSIAALVKAEVDRALAIIKGSDTVSGKKDPKDMTPAELKVEHDRLQAALEALPFVGETVTDRRPGEIIGTGLVTEYVPHTHKWFEDIEERRKDRNKHNGKPAELTWPNYSMHDIIWQGTKPETLTINNVSYGLVPGLRCQVPTPFYQLYLDSIAGLKRHAEQFAPPTPSTNPGYLHVNISQTNGRPVAVLLGKGALPGQAEREAQDVPVTT